MRTDFWKRYEKLCFKLVNEVQIMNIKEEIQKKVKERVDKTSARVYFKRAAETYPGRGRERIPRYQMRRSLKIP